MQPFTRAEALQAGIPDSALRGPGFRRLMGNVYVDSAVELTPALAAKAPLAVAPPSAWVSHVSAARLLGVPVPTLPGEHISVLAKQDRLRRSGVTSHVAPGTSLVTRRGGARISAPAQLFVELASQLGLVDLVVAGDWLVRQGLVTLEVLREFCAASQLRASVLAREAVVFVRERVDSPMETRVRMLLVLAGLPEPVVNLKVNVGDGSGRRRYDLSWAAVKVIVEYDGRHHAERIEQWEKDLLRREGIDDDGWRMIVLVAKDVYSRPDRTLERVVRVLRARGLEGLPRHLDDSWRAHFPVRTEAMEA
ncbi:DUF559 domain-containing protein [Nocardioides cavernaquae]|nr:DUF559 domain-containing protein [Nocardioides cavernaquae]